MTTLSVVIPAWNAAARLPACLAALATQTRPADEIVVVDNGSTDGTADLIHAGWPQVRLIANRENVGFAAAMNQAILASVGATVVALNDDTLPAPACLAALLEPFARDPGLGACAATLIYANQPQVINGAGFRVGRDLVAMDEAMGQAVGGLPEAPWTVFGASGGAAAFRRAALDDVGLFDGRFFAYLEDVDLAWRLRLRGWRTMAIPAARVAHAYSASGGADSPFKRYHLARNRVWCLIKNVPAELWRTCGPPALWYDTAALLAALASGDRAWLRGRRDGLWAARSFLPERRAIQRRRTATSAELLALLGPRVGPIGVWRARRDARQMGI